MQVVYPLPLRHLVHAIEKTALFMGWPNRFWSPEYDKIIKKIQDLRNISKIEQKYDVFIEIWMIYGATAKYIRVSFLRGREVGKNMCCNNKRNLIEKRMQNVSSESKYLYNFPCYTRSIATCEKIWCSPIASELTISAGVGSLWKMLLPHFSEQHTCIQWCTTREESHESKS